MRFTSGMALASRWRNIEVEKPGAPAGLFCFSP
jgi:hypothetical protein